MPMLSHKICDVDSSLHFELGCFCGEHVQLIKRRMLDIYIYITAKKDWLFQPPSAVTLVSDKPRRHAMVISLLEANCISN